MKRDPSLARFSREHHVALFVAQRLKRASESDARASGDAFLGYWRSDGREHFREEEEVLLPTFAGFADPDIPVVARMLIDHVRIRRLAVDIASGPPNAALLRTLGELLEQHIRLAERELFPLIEQAVPRSELERLVALLGD
jgi:hypothetical protein